jgi:hypothetical protein
MLLLRTYPCSGSVLKDTTHRGSEEVALAFRPSPVVVDSDVPVGLSLPSRRLTFALEEAIQSTSSIRVVEDRGRMREVALSAVSRLVDASESVCTSAVDALVRTSAVSECPLLLLARERRDAGEP